MEHPVYKWEMTLSEVRTKQPGKRIDYAGVRWLLNGVKSMHRKENNPEIKKHLAIAGENLNLILLK